ncbi:MAG: histidine kinase, partial [Phaeodactylibacter sp.]|nr:histidine kinase [Phaeodactylibacter sp.]
VVVLSPSENVLNISFSAINFTFPTATTFQYRMEGVDEDWQQPGGNRSITYTNLKGGDYRFLLKASNNEGIWSKQPATLAIHVGTPWYKTAWFYGLLALMGLGLIYLIYNFRVRQIQKESRLKADFENQIATIEMSALRAQMNPHFIFNCLNSIELYIIKNDTQKAAAYLSNFSRLVRLILQNSRSNFVNLKDELEALKLYIKLEQMRFRYSFDYVLDIEPGLDPEDYDIPPMLIQPFIENAIWHGLNQKDEKGKVQISIRNGEEVITCTIEDDGIGRVASERINAAKKVKRKSMGMSITQERIDIINKLYNTNNQVEIQDLYSPEGAPSGTRVIINIPI